MKRIFLVFKRDYREIRSMTAFKIMLGIAAFVTVGAAIGISIAFHMQSWYGEAEAAPVLDFITGLVIYFFPLVVLIAFIWAFASFPVVKEKVNGGIECLIATPLTPRALLAGKSLAVFVPGYVISLVALVILVVTLNLAVFLPGWGVIIFPWLAVILGLLVNPLLFSGVLSITLFLSMASNPDAAVMPSFLIGFGLMMGMPIGLTNGSFDVTSWNFVLWYFLVTLVFRLVLLFVMRNFSRQRVVLSSKGS